MMTAGRLGLRLDGRVVVGAGQVMAWGTPQLALRILAECEKSSGTMPDSSDRMSTLQADPGSGENQRGQRRS